MKMYFQERDGEQCFTKSGIIALMKDTGETEIVVFEAERCVSGEFMFCWDAGEVIERGSCGRTCSSYDPCNGRSGKCRNLRPCYEPGRRCLINVNGKMVVDY